MRVIWYGRLGDVTPELRTAVACSIARVTPVCSLAPGVLARGTDLGLLRCDKDGVLPGEHVIRFSLSEVNRFAADWGRSVSDAAEIFLGRDICSLAASLDPFDQQNGWALLCFGLVLDLGVGALIHSYGLVDMAPAGVWVWAIDDHEALSPMGIQASVQRPSASLLRMWGREMWPASREVALSKDAAEAIAALHVGTLSFSELLPETKLLLRHQGVWDAVNARFGLPVIDTAYWAELRPKLVEISAQIFHCCLLPSIKAVVGGDGGGSQRSIRLHGLFRIFMELVFARFAGRTDLMPLQNSRSGRLLLLGQAVETIYV